MDRKKAKCHGGECCMHGFTCQEWYPEGCHVHFISLSNPFEKNEIPLHDRFLLLDGETHEIN